MKKIWIVVAISVIVALVWVFPEESVENFDGEIYFSYVLEPTAEWENVDARTIVTWESNLIGSEEDILVFESRQIAVSQDTGEVVWTLSETYSVDKNWKNVDKEGYFAFPPNVEKKDYIIWSLATFNKPITWNFEAVSDELAMLDYVPEDIKNLQTYRFRWRTNEFHGIAWIEPTTGILVRYETGDNNQEWGRQFSEDTLVKQVRLAQKELNNRPDKFI
tara:strand:- start:3734 stop:4390 length:657 start_codon:yes stop_codon:yes gene_type:complete